MLIKRILISALAAVAVGALTLAPETASAQKAKDKGHDMRWNPASPKKNGRHDNRDWNKKNHDRVVVVKKYRDDDDDDNDDDGDRRRRYRSGRRDREYIVVRRQSEHDRRQQTKNEWRNLAYASGAIAALGLIKNDRTLFFAGTAGALYSVHRYEEDRKSQNKSSRLRAYYFSRPYFVRDGRRYDRKLVSRNGKKYYQFVCR